MENRITNVMLCAKKEKISQLLILKLNQSNDKYYMNIIYISFTMLGKFTSGENVCISIIHIISIRHIGILVQSTVGDRGSGSRPGLGGSGWFNRNDGWINFHWICANLFHLQHFKFNTHRKWMWPFSAAFLFPCSLSDFFFLGMR